MYIKECIVYDPSVSRVIHINIHEEDIIKIKRIALMNKHLKRESVIIDTDLVPLLEIDTLSIYYDDSTFYIKLDNFTCKCEIYKMKKLTEHVSYKWYDKPKYKDLRNFNRLNSYVGLYEKYNVFLNCRILNDRKYLTYLNTLTNEIYVNVIGVYDKNITRYVYNN